MEVQLLIKSEPELTNVFVDLTPAEVQEFSGDWFKFALLEPTMDVPFPSPDDLVMIKP